MVVRARECSAQPARRSDGCREPRRQWRMARLGHGPRHARVAMVGIHVANGGAEAPSPLAAEYCGPARTDADPAGGGKKPGRGRREGAAGAGREAEGWSGPVAGGPGGGSGETAARPPGMRGS
jgi:hypothetical protein